MDKTRLLSFALEKIGTHLFKKVLEWIQIWAVSSSLLFDKSVNYVVMLV